MTIRRRAGRWVVKDGRWGPYVTDGETNASLRKGDTVEELTVERASELLADRRAQGPPKKKATKKKAKKKAKKAAKVSGSATSGGGGEKAKKASRVSGSATSGGGG